MGKNKNTKQKKINYIKQISTEFTVKAKSAMLSLASDITKLENDVVFSFSKITDAKTKLNELEQQLISFKKKIKDEIN
jgi:hypothetical protein